MSLIGKEFLPVVHIEKISYQRINISSKAIIRVSMYDTKEGTWSRDEKFFGYLRIRILAAYSEDLIEKISSGQLRPNEPKGNPLYHEEILSNFIKIEPYVVDGVTYRKYQKEITIEFNSDPFNLSIFANSEIDLQDLKDNEALNLSYTRESYMGAVTGEDVLRGGQQVKISNIFYDEQESPWAGPTHDHTSGYMEGSKHLITPHGSLRLSKTVNNKLTFLPSLSYQESGQGIQESLRTGRRVVGLEMQESLRTGRRVVGFGIQENIGAPTINPPMTTTSTLSDRITPGAEGPTFQQDYVQDILGNINGVFITDLYSLSLQESRIAEILYKHDKALFQQIAENLNVKNIEINRTVSDVSANLNAFNLPINKINTSNPTLIAKSFNNSRKIKEKVLYKINATEKISVRPSEIKMSSRKKIFDGTEITKDVLDQGQKIGSMKQLNLSLPKNMRAISFTDHEVKNIRGREFFYFSKIQIEDDFLKRMKELLHNLKKYSYKLQNFYNVLIAKSAFDGEKFKASFISSYYSQYGIEIDEETGTITSEIDRDKLKNIFIFKAFDILGTAEKASGLNSIAKIQLESFNLFSTDLKNMNKSIEYYNKVIGHFERTYSIQDENSYNKSSTKTARKDRPMIERNLELKTPYTKPLISKIGFNFISMKNHEGMSRIKISDFSKRAETERKKFFKSTPTKASPLLKDLKEEDKGLFVDLEKNRFKHFSPSTVFFGNKAVDTTSLNPKSMDVDFFNNLKFSREMIEGNNEEDFSIIDKEEEQSLYVDSRDFLGESTKFTNAVLGVLRKTPMKLPAIRKEFKLLDRSVLGRKKSKISLDSFDLSSKNNTVREAYSADMDMVPMQVKALTLLRGPATNFNVDNLGFDPLVNPQTDEVIKQNFLNIGKVEVLSGFKTSNGIPMMGEPIFNEITPEGFEELKGKNVLCQINNNNFNGLTIDDSSNFQIYDKTFILESTEEEIMDIPNPQPLSGSPEDEMIEVFVDTILSPVFYSSNIITQNEDNASVVEVLKVIEISQSSTPVSQTVTTTPTIGTY